MKRKTCLTVCSIAVVFLSIAPGEAADIEAGFRAFRNGDDKAAMREWLPLAEKGDPLAEALVGELYAQGRGVAQDYAQAAMWLKRATEKGFGHCRLGHLYASGHGVTQDQNEALKQYQGGAALGDACSQFVLGSLVLGSRYANPQAGVPFDYGLALKWLRASAENGYCMAQNSLGTMYWLGQGVPQDYEEAARWHLRSAAQGDRLGQMNLAGAYERGEGVPQDAILAHMWFNLSAIGGDRDAVSARERLARIMTAAQLSEAQRLAREYRPKNEVERNPCR